MSSLGEKTTEQQKATGQGHALGRAQLLPRICELPHSGQRASPHVHAAPGVRDENEGKNGAAHPASRAEIWGRVHLEGNTVGQLRNSGLVEDQLLEDEANCGDHTPVTKAEEEKTADKQAREPVSISNDSSSNTRTL